MRTVTLLNIDSYIKLGSVTVCSELGDICEFGIECLTILWIGQTLGIKLHQTDDRLKGQDVA